MGCGCNGQPGEKPMFKREAPKEPSILKNLAKAASTQNNKIQWFLDGATGIAKCLMGKHIYNDEQIQKHRDICSECEFASAKKDGRITTKSQCMAVDPNTNQICGCEIICKSSQGTCALNKWTNLTIGGKS